MKAQIDTSVGGILSLYFDVFAEGDPLFTSAAITINLIDCTIPTPTTVTVDGIGNLLNTAISTPLKIAG